MFEVKNPANDECSVAGSDNRQQYPPASSSSIQRVGLKIRSATGVLYRFSVTERIVSAHIGEDPNVLFKF